MGLSATTCPTNSLAVIKVQSSSAHSTGSAASVPLLKVVDVGLAIDQTEFAAALDFLGQPSPRLRDHYQIGSDPLVGNGLSRL
jgi:hypothetical protein